VAARPDAPELPLAAEFAARLSDNERVGAKVAHAMSAISSLGISSELASGPRSLESLARACDVEADALNRLLRFLGPVEVAAEVEPGLFGLAPLGHFASGSPQPVSRGVEWYWAAWAAIAEGLRARRTPFEVANGRGLFDFLESDPKAARFFTTALARQRIWRNAAVLEAYEFAHPRCVIDVGGGDGALLGGVLAANPDARGVLFDRAHVIEHSDPGLSPRCRRVAGDFFAEVPPGGDVYVVANILHDWDDTQSARILSACRHAMEPGALLLIVEVVLPEDRPPFDMLILDLEMMVLTGGRERTEAEFGALLGRTGFRPGRTVPTGSPWSIVEAVAA
jgi:hypothetical protein